MSLTVTAADGAGAYVDKLDLNNLSESEAEQIRQALGEYGVLFFRNQSLTPENHIALALRYGAININRFFTALDEFPQIAQVLKEPEHEKNIGEMWHTDHSYDQIPALGSILVARELPDSGGDTCFLSMFAAYDALSEKTKTRIEGLTATHSSRHVFGVKARQAKRRQDLNNRVANPEAATQDAIHPLAIKHPISGKRALYVNPEFTVGINELEKTEGDALLEELYEHTRDDKFMHRFDWQDGSIAFWDNRATWHRALNDYPGQRRLMHRITIEGVDLR